MTKGFQNNRIYVDEKGEQIRDKIVYQDIVSLLSNLTFLIDDFHPVNASKALWWPCTPSLRHVHQPKKDLLRLRIIVKDLPQAYSTGCARGRNGRRIPTQKFSLNYC
jgi:hypothetical protein